MKNQEKRRKRKKKTLEELTWLNLCSCNYLLRCQPFFLVGLWLGRSCGGLTKTEFYASIIFPVSW